MVRTEVEYEPFVLAMDDPFLSALIGTIEEPRGSVTAALACKLTLSWWDSHGVGPSCEELLDAVFPDLDWEDAIEDPGRTLKHRRAQRELLQRWLIDYWTRVGAINYIPGHDEFVRPGRV